MMVLGGDVPGETQRDGAVTVFMVMVVVVLWETVGGMAGPKAVRLPRQGSVPCLSGRRSTNVR